MISTCSDTSILSHQSHQSGSQADHMTSQDLRQPSMRLGMDKLETKDLSAAEPSWDM
jgi:hypothetical protein